MVCFPIVYLNVWCDAYHNAYTDGHVSYQIKCAVVGVLTRHLYLSCVQGDDVIKVQFTTKGNYTVMQPGQPTKKLFKCYLADPQPPLPAVLPVGMEDVPSLGDWVEVQASSIKDLQTAKKKFKFLEDGLHILSTDWEAFQEDMSVHDLKIGENFLLYYQYLDTTAAVCKTKATARKLPAKKQRR